MSTKKSLTIILVALLFLLAGCAQQSQQKIASSVTQKSDANNNLVRISAEDADAAEPALAAAPDGTAYIAWVEHRENKEADVMLAHLDSEGKMKDAPVRVNPQAGAATAWRGDPPTVKVASDGTVYVGWTARFADSQSHGNDLYISASHDGGRTFAQTVKVNDDARQVVHGMHSLAVGADGRIYVAWLDERNVLKPPSENKMDGMQKMEHMEANREVFMSFSTDGGRTFSQNQRVALDACPCCKTAVAVSTDGHVFIGWRQVLPGEYRHIAVAASADGGKTFAQPVIVSDDRWMIAACPVSGPALSVGSDNALRVIWYTEGEKGSPGIYWAESSDNGKTFSESKTFARGEARGTPSFLVNNNSVASVIWESDENGSARVMTARFDKDKEGPSASPVASAGELPSAASSPDGLFVGYIAKVNDRRSIWVVKTKPVI